MKTCSAVFGIVVSTIIVAFPVSDSRPVNAADKTPTLSDESTDRNPPPSVESQRHPPETRLFESLTSWEYDDGTQHLSFEDVCKTEPKLFQVFEMDTSPGNDEEDVSARRVKQILDTHGWSKCKSVDTESGTSLIRTRRMEDSGGQAISLDGAGDSFGITITEEEIKPPPVPPNVPISITAEWKTYRNASLGFEISYPSNWGIFSVSARIGAVTTIGNCYEENCLTMRLATDEYEGDGFQIVISPEKMPSGEPCVPGTMHSRTQRFTSYGVQYSGCSVWVIPPPKPSTDYAIGTYPTWADMGEFSIFETCDRRLNLWTTVGDYRYQFTPEGAELLPNSYALRDVYRKILSTVKVTPVRLATGVDNPAPPVR